MKGLEEAITCGQFDKAAALAKELAATKQRQTGLKFDSSSSSPSPLPQEAETGDGEANAKPAVAKRTVVPVQERAPSRSSTGSSFQSPVPPVPAERSLSRVSNSSGSIYANVNGSDDARPVPVKRQPKSDGQRTLRRATEQTKGRAVVEETGESVESVEVRQVPSPARRVLVRQISMEGQVRPPEPVLPAEKAVEKRESVSLSRILDRKDDASEVRTRDGANEDEKKQAQTKASSKVDSGQQTTIPYRKIASPTAVEDEPAAKVSQEDPSFK